MTKRQGRPPKDGRSVKVTTTLRKSTVEAIDKTRGEVPRSTFVSELVEGSVSALDRGETVTITGATLAREVCDG